ncbi:response regulator transcription factor [Brevibacterium sp. 50QC2O2]|uniref:response regulator transcription factor n=1 Tax=Brevibacterium sp. 50QC2O2 TaxID=2968459 RepID=UPI00211C63EF|nr:response regulator transcription factor [Brevibacterium sp. 50QC2O2]
MDTGGTRILLVDDDPAIRDSVGSFLQRAGFAVSCAADGLEALAQLAAGQGSGPAVVVSDVMMPGLDGRELLRRMRAAGIWTPVLLLTRVGQAAERSAALDEGADDYLNKPFEPQELASRIRALVRRSRPAPGPVADVLVAGPRSTGEVRLEREGRRVFLGPAEVSLTPRAFALLDFFMMHPDETHSRETLLERVWGFESVVASRAVDHRIAELRRVLHEDASDPTLIRTVPGGYRLIAAVRRG